VAVNPPDAVLREYFRAQVASLEAEYGLARQATGSTLKGNLREGFVRSFLQKALPGNLDIGAGEIVDTKSQRSGQLDVVISRRDSPRLSLHGAEANLYLAESVFAAVEVKSELTLEETRGSVRLLKTVATLQTKVEAGIQFGPFLQRPIRAVFAYRGSPLDSVVGILAEPGNSGVVDLVYVLNRGLATRVEIGRAVGIVPPDAVSLQNDGYVIHLGPAMGLGILYYVLNSYTGSFIALRMSLRDYFQGKWD
jgi:hypothetical protein